ETDDARPDAERTRSGALAEDEPRIDARRAEAGQHRPAALLASRAQSLDERVPEALGAGDFGFGDAGGRQAEKAVALAAEQPARRGDQRRHRRRVVGEDHVVAQLAAE